MKVDDMKPEEAGLYCQCLEDWSDEMAESGDHKQKWYEFMRDKGLRVKLAHDDQGEIGGMIQYIPIEWSFAAGNGLYIVLCIWVHGHSGGRGNFQGHGMGQALLKAAEDDVRSLGAKGLVVWGLILPVFMRASWFKKQGYKKVDRTGMQLLLWKPFTDDALPPRWVKANKQPPIAPGKLTVTAFKTGWCPAFNMCYERTRRAAQELGSDVVLIDYDTLDRATYTEWGISDAIFFDHQELRTGPPPSYEKIKRRMEKSLKKAQKRAK